MRFRDETGATSKASSQSNGKYSARASPRANKYFTESTPSIQHIGPNLPLRYKQASQHRPLLTDHPHEEHFDCGNTPPFEKRYLRPIVVAEQSYIAPQCDLYYSPQRAILLHRSTTIGTHLGLISLHAAKYIAGALPLKHQPSNDAEEEGTLLKQKGELRKEEKYLKLRIVNGKETSYLCAQPAGHRSTLSPPHSIIRKGTTTTDDEKNRIPPHPMPRSTLLSPTLRRVP